METGNLERRRVYDPALRAMHWWNAGAIVALLATAWSSELFEHGPVERTLWQAHIWLGYALIVGVAARVAWGIVGPRYARFADLWHPRAWGAALRLRYATAASRFGHDPLASLAYLAVYALLGAMAVSGLALAAIEHGAGPLAPALGDMAWLKHLFSEPHEAIATTLAAFVGVHLTMLGVHQYRDRNGIAASMLTGLQYRRREETGHA
jgi:cytochrome b